LAISALLQVLKPLSAQRLKMPRLTIAAAAMIIACLGGNCRESGRTTGGTSGKFASRWQKDPDAAQIWLLEQTGNDRQRYMEAILASGHFNTWAEKTPAQLAGAVLNFPAAETPRHLAGVFETWVAADADAAGKFIDGKLKPGPARDAAVIALVEGIRDDHLHEAVAWARTIDDQGRMYSLLESLATH
jgi:hypothetical protein